jgi:hypothetical protein
MRSIADRLAPVALTVGVALTAGALLLPARAAATSSAKEVKAATQAGAAYLKTLQQPSGGFETDWVLGALAAAGDAAANVKAPGAATDARSYYRELVGDPAAWPGSEPSPSDFERAALNAYAAGIDPARVSVAQNLIAQIASYYDPSDPGYYGGTSNFTSTVFAAVALGETRTRSGAQRMPQALLEKSIAALEANQHDDGGWTYQKAAGEPSKLAEPAEPDETGAVMAALCSAGVSAGSATIVDAENYLKGDLVDSTGAFNAPFGANTDSNAWAVQGLNVCGIDPQGPGFTTAMGKTPIDFLISQQVSGGGFLYEAGEAEANEYSSQDAVRALSGAGFTARPPAAKGASRWVFESRFQPGQQSLLTLIVNNGTSNLKVCAVSLSPTGASIKLATLLEAAETSSTPAGCVSSFAPTSGTGAITQVNGSPTPAEPKWDVSIDGGGEKEAKRTSKIALGDTIYLRLA